MAKKKDDTALDPALLKGLKFRGAELKNVTDRDTGVVKEKSIPFERALTVDDVLDWFDKGDSVVLVTADGQKFTVKK